jgi:FkbM family methyltransferase
MTFAEKYLSPIHTFISKSRFITILAIKIRNQCNLIISRRFGTKSMSPHLNGEYLLLDHIMPVCNTYFDVGANKGNWTAYILKNTPQKHAKFYLYEPGKAAYEILSHRFNDTKNFYYFPFAISDRKGSIDFYEEENAGELSSAVIGWGSGDISTIQVPTTTVDEEMKRLGLSFLDFLKIDTEGFELKVIEGAMSAIHNNNIGFIQFEYNFSWAMIGASLRNVYKILEGSGYKIFLIQPKGLYEYDAHRYGEFYAFSNFIAVAPAKFHYTQSLIKGSA